MARNPPPTAHHTAHAAEHDCKKYLHSGRCEEILGLGRQHLLHHDRSTSVRSHCQPKAPQAPDEGRQLASRGSLQEALGQCSLSTPGRHWPISASTLTAESSLLSIQNGRHFWPQFPSGSARTWAALHAGVRRGRSGREAVTQQHWEEYLVYCNECMMREEPRNHWSTAMRAWNWIAEQFPDERLPIIPNPGTDRWRGIPWEDTPARLKEEMELLRQWQLAGNLDEFDELDEDEALENEIYEQKPMSPRLSRRPTTMTFERISPTWCSQAFRWISWTLSQHSSTPRMSSERNAINWSAKGLRKPDRKLCYRLHCQISAVISAARYFRRSHANNWTPEEAAGKVRPPKGAMSPKVQSRLAQFSRDEVEADYLNLPYRVARELQKVDQPNKLDALEMQSAAALALMHEWPARIGNIAQLDFNIHIKRPPGGQPGSWYIQIPADDVKNEVELNVELPAECSALLELYRMKFRPILLGESTCSRLFINQFGTVKSWAAAGCPTQAIRQAQTRTRMECTPCPRVRRSDTTGRTSRSLHRCAEGPRSQEHQDDHGRLCNIRDQGVVQDLQRRDRSPQRHVAPDFRDGAERRKGYPSRGRGPVND